jgi:F0F1-type ATP synthase membrane subunit b/b'
MFSLLNPWVIIGVIVALTGVFYYGHHDGYQQRVNEDQAEIARLNEQSRQTEQRLNEQINQTSTQLQEANNVVAKKQTDLNRAIAAGRVRLPTPSCVQASTSPTTPTGDRFETSSESDRETLRLIAEIAAEGDRAINQLNACIDAYNQVRSELNGQR